MTFAIELPYIDICRSQKEFDAYCKSCNYPSEDWLKDNTDGCIRTHLSKNNDLCFSVCLAERPAHIDDIQFFGLITHEAVHIWQNMCEHYNEREPGSEAEAYTIQRIAQAIAYTCKRDEAKAATKLGKKLPKKAKRKAK